MDFIFELAFDKIPSTSLVKAGDFKVPKSTDRVSFVESLVEELAEDEFDSDPELEPAELDDFAFDLLQYEPAKRLDHESAVVASVGFSVALVNVSEANVVDEGVVDSDDVESKVVVDFDPFELEASSLLSLSSSFGELDDFELSVVTDAEAIDS